MFSTPECSMNAFSSLLQQGNAWLFVPSAILLGALHGLEPGHSNRTLTDASTVKRSPPGKSRYSA